MDFKLSELLQNLSGRFRNFGRKILHPFPLFPLIAGQYYSKLDVAAEKLGLPHIEQVFRHAAIEAICVPLSRFFRDDEARRALKKAYHVVFEHRLRTLALRMDPAENHGFDPISLPEGNHPLDEAARKELARIDARAMTLSVNSGYGMICTNMLRPLLWGSALIAAAVWTAVRHGSLRVSPRYVRILATDSWRAANYLALHRAAEDASIRNGETIVVAIGHEPVGSFSDLPVIDLRRLPVHFLSWIRTVILPALRLVAGVFGQVYRRPYDPVIMELAAQGLNLACRSLNVIRWEHSLRFKFFLDSAEHDPLHLLIGIVARRVGGRVVRIPRTISDSYGTLLSYYGYDVFLSSGPYQAQTYGETWYPGERIAIGMIQNDRRLQSEVTVISLYSTPIRERLAAGKKMIVLFGPSSVAGIFRQMRDLFDCVVRTMSGRDDWFLVVKPKMSDRLHLELQKDARYTKWQSAVDTIIVRYPETGKEVCSTGWLLEHMTCGISAFGTVPLEGLVQKKPFFVHAPVYEPTPFKKACAEYGLLHDHYDKFAEKLSEFLDRPDTLHIPFDDIRSKFDPFCDKRALERFAQIVFSDSAECGTRVSRTTSEPAPTTAIHD